MYFVFASNTLSFITTLTESLLAFSASSSNFLFWASNLASTSDFMFISDSEALRTATDPDLTINLSIEVFAAPKKPSATNSATVSSTSGTLIAALVTDTARAL